MTKRTTEYFAFAIAIFLSAWLVFQVQPIISKAILPWYGGSPAVWTTCLVFFQVALFAGYLYAHGLASLPPLAQALLHSLLAITALALLPIIPGNEWKPSPDDSPALSILTLLVAHVGLPYMVLAATGPLLQSWFARGLPDTSPYRLYSLSNVGSLVALLSYPVLFEPTFTIGRQGWIWSAAFAALVVLLVGLAIRQRSYSPMLSEESNSTKPFALNWRLIVIWIGLPALATSMLMSSTNHICTDVAVVPFLWIVPLSLYLTTFIWAFAKEGGYSERFFGLITMISLLAVAYSVIENGLAELWLELLVHLVGMFLVCLISHLELVRRKPPKTYLTLFYLMISLGGALGGLITALLCPQIFNRYVEYPICLVLGYGLAMYVTLRAAGIRWAQSASYERDTADPELPRVQQIVLQFVLVGGLLVVGWSIFGGAPNNAIVIRRNFYGVVSVCKEEKEGLLFRQLQHGSTVHGRQFADTKKKFFPTSYYYPESGVGLAILRYRFHHPGKVNIGTVGLGIGTLAAYGLAGDTIQFYEINQHVVDLANSHFTFLSGAKATIKMTVGDARLSLERQENQQFDILVLDAFSSDSVPSHLLTKEAFDLYLKHLKPSGVLAVHVSNRHLDLPSLVGQQALTRKLRWRLIETDGKPVVTNHLAQWMLISGNQHIMDDAVIEKAAKKFKFSKQRMWTDQYSNLLMILR